MGKVDSGRVDVNITKVVLTMSFILFDLQAKNTAFLKDWHPLYAFWLVSLMLLVQHRNQLPW